MKQDIGNREIKLEEAICAVKADEPSTTELREARGRVWQQVLAADTDTSLSFDAAQIRSCEDVRQLLPAYSAHSLPPERALLIEAHLEDCLACRHRAHAPADPALDWSTPRPEQHAGIRLRP